jgi:hypothetical protein
MKSIIAIITLLSNVAFAQLEVIDIEMSRTVAQLNNVDAQIKSIKLNASGVISIAQRQGGNLTVKLTEKNRNEMLDLAQNLSAAEVQTDVRTMVCKLALNPLTITDLLVVDSQTDNLRLVLSYSSCALTSYTYPVQEFQLDSAKTLKTQLIVLARQVIANLNYSTQPIANLE